MTDAPKVPALPEWSEHRPPASAEVEAYIERCRTAGRAAQRQRQELERERRRMLTTSTAQEIAALDQRRLLLRAAEDAAEARVTRAKFVLEAAQRREAQENLPGIEQEVRAALKERDRLAREAAEAEARVRTLAGKLDAAWSAARRRERPGAHVDVPPTNPELVRRLREEFGVALGHVRTSVPEVPAPVAHVGFGPQVK